MFDWTPERIEELKLDWATGFTATRIAKKFQISRSAILGKVDRLNLASRAVLAKPWAKEDEDQLRILWDEGKTGRFIAEQLGFTKSAVLKKAQRLNLSRRLNTGGRGRGIKSKRPMQPRLSPFQRILAGMNAPKPDVSLEFSGISIEAVAFMDLEPHHCRFPVADTPIMFCGNDRGKGVPYCYGHCRIAYNKPPVQRTTRSHQFGEWV